MFLCDFFLKEVTCKKYLNLQTISWQPQGHLFEESSPMTSFSKRFSQFQTLYWLYGFGSASSFRWQMILAFALSLYFAGFKRFWKYEYQTGREPGWRISHARDHILVYQGLFVFYSDMYLLGSLFLFALVEITTHTCKRKKKKKPLLLRFKRREMLKLRATCLQKW